jgi:hypothetical protein
MKLQIADCRVIADSVLQIDCRFHHLLGGNQSALSNQSAILQSEINLQSRNPK